jgi:hypothetical protein
MDFGLPSVDSTGRDVCDKSNGRPLSAICDISDHRFRRLYHSSGTGCAPVVSNRQPQTKRYAERADSMPGILRTPLPEPSLVHEATSSGPLDRRQMTSWLPSLPSSPCGGQWLRAQCAPQFGIRVTVAGPRRIRTSFLSTDLMDYWMLHHGVRRDASRSLRDSHPFDRTAPDALLDINMISIASQTTLEI